MRYLISLLYLFAAFGLSAQEHDRSVLRLLDKQIKERNIYIQAKEKRINALKFQLQDTEDPELEFDVSNDLFEEYKVFQYDSAYIYALKALEFAQESGNQDDIVEAQCDLLFCYSSVGFFKEGGELISSISLEGVSTKEQTEFYMRCAHYYQNLSLLVKGTQSLFNEYQDRQKYYTIKAQEGLSKSGFSYKFFKTQEAILKHGANDSIVMGLKDLLETPNISGHNRAIVCSQLGVVYNQLGNRSAAIYYMAYSMIYDIQSSVFDTTAAQMLATYMMEAGDINRASRYIKVALDDANRYNTRLRKFEIQAILPRIESLRYDYVSGQRLHLALTTLIIAIMLGFMVSMFVKIKRKNRSLRAARRELESRAHELVETNDKLSDVNAELEESNRIKDLYIIKSLYGDSDFVDKVEKNCKLFERKLRAKQYSELQGIFKEMDIKQQRNKMSLAFDSAFLKLFPNFMIEYNKLFPEEHQVVIGEEEALPPEVRIFALIRLGVDDPAMIARYLNLSQNTIYVYKAKVKSKTLVPKEEFEAIIKGID